MEPRKTGGPPGPALFWVPRLLLASLYTGCLLSCPVQVLPPIIRFCIFGTFRWDRFKIQNSEKVIESYEQIFLTIFMYAGVWKMLKWVYSFGWLVIFHYHQLFIHLFPTAEDAFSLLLLLSFLLPTFYFLPSFAHPSIRNYTYSTTYLEHLEFQFIKYGDFLKHKYSCH